MNKYIRVNVVVAVPMTREEFNASCCGVPAAEERPNPLQEGYFIRYDDGYSSWCPKSRFDKVSRPIDGMTFGMAVEALKMGKKVSRRGWNGKGMYLCLASDIEFHTKAEIGPARGGCTVSPCIVMKTAKDDFQPGWLASQADMLSDDWTIVG